MTKGAIKRGGSETDAKTLELLGCSIEECRKHIEIQFDQRMTWDDSKHDRQQIPFFEGWMLWLSFWISLT